MSNWITSKERKNHQRAMTKLLKEVNQCLQNDEMWRTRFEIRQHRADWIPYEDGSGEELYVQLALIDHVKNNIVYTPWESVNHWRFINGYHLYDAINDFIISA